MRTLLLQPLNRGRHVRVVRSLEDLPSELHPEAKFFPLGRMADEALDRASAEQLLRFAETFTGVSLGDALAEMRRASAPAKLERTVDSDVEAGKG